VVTSTHTTRWYGVAGDGELVPRNRHMRGGDWGWVAVCSCGERFGGGQIEARVREEVASHRWDVDNGWWHPDGISSAPAAIAAREALR